MKFSIPCAALALTLCTLPATVLAQSDSSSSNRPLRFVIGAGLTQGGEKLATVQFDDGSSDNIKSGGLLHVYTGAEYRFTPEWSGEVNVGYHVSDTREAANGSLKFARVPLELIGRYAITPEWRVGAGLRQSTNVKLKGSGVLAGQARFKNATGFVVEGEYLMNEQFGVKLRAVSEKFEPKEFSEKYKGNHVGLYFVGYF